MDSLSRRFNPKKYQIISAINEQDSLKLRINDKLKRKYLSNDGTYKMTLREKILILVEHIKRYYNRIRVIITIIAPVIILIWYYFQSGKQGGESTVNGTTVGAKYRLPSYLDTIR